MASVICENVIKIYRSGELKSIALSNLSLHVNEGEFRVIAGPSGSGKTTLLNLIGGIDIPDAGKIVVDGEDITKYTEEERIRYRRTKVGFVFQFFNLIPYLTALENVEFPMIVAGAPREERRKRALELLKLVGLEGKKDHKPNELSGGEQQRVAIAVALANDPPLILADEPTGELDFETGRQIVKLFRDLHKQLNKTIIIVTHDFSIAMYADRISLLRDGKVIETISPAEKDLLGLLSLPKEDVWESLKKRKEALLEEIRRLEEEYRKGVIDIDTLVNRYTKVRKELDEIESKLNKMKI